MGASLLSPVHLVVLAVALLLLFGAKRLPEVGRSLGAGMREFKDSISSSAGAIGGEAEPNAVALAPAESTPTATPPG